MNKKALSFCSLVLAITLCFGFFSCKKDDSIKIWVGVESKDFYQEKVDQWVEAYKAANGGKAFPWAIRVEGVDTGSAAGKFLDDTAAGGDIFTIAHDNLGRLIAGSSAIAPVTNEALLRQIQNDNPSGFLEAIKGKVAGTEYTFGIPYIAQALVLYYNTSYLTEEDVKTWEGIWRVAKENGKQSVSINGDDGYNNSFIVLAERASDGKRIADIYVNGEFENCNFNSDLALATLRWGQRFFTDASPDKRVNYGAKKVGDSGWEMELANEASLSLVGGAWNFNAARAALGSKLGIAVLPSFTLTEADVEGTSIAAGTVMNSGTFADTKMFVVKKHKQGEKKAEYLEEILIYLSSKEMQEQSFIHCANLPAYKNASTEFAALQQNTLEGKLAKMQIEMFANGRPQPFGPNARMNNWYYSQGAPMIVLNILMNTDNLYDTTAQIREGMAIIETIWKTGRRPE